MQRENRTAASRIGAQTPMFQRRRAFFYFGDHENAAAKVVFFMSAIGAKHPAAPSSSYESEGCENKTMKKPTRIHGQPRTLPMATLRKSARVRA